MKGSPELDERSWDWRPAVEMGKKWNGFGVEEELRRKWLQTKSEIHGGLVSSG